MAQSLQGLWHYQAMERQVITDRELLVTTEDLPPAGTMQIPQNWEKGGLANFHGRVKFWRRFTGPVTEPGDRVMVVFEGVDYRATVVLNGTPLGTHEGYFQAFEWDITDVIRHDEDNLLEVLVDCPKEDPHTIWPDQKVLIKGVFGHHDARPGGWMPQFGQDQPTGGIWGEVSIDVRPETYVAGVQIQSTLLESGKAWVRAQVTVQATARGKALVGIDWQGQDTQQTVNVVPGSNRFDICFLLDNPELWWTWDLGTPYLYAVRAYVGQHKRSHQVDMAFGIRDISYTPQTGEWRLNGKRLFLRGTNVIPTQWLSTYTEPLIQKDIELLREAHVNAVRVHAHVNRQGFYAACDRAGILVWQDFALQWSYRETPEVVQSATTQIADMVVQLFNHPSIFTWCCHNEPSVNAQSLDPVLAQVVGGLDATRHVHVQSGFSEHPYWGWYLDDYGAFRDAPMGPLVTEFGAQAFPNEHLMQEWHRDGQFDIAQLTYHNFQWDETVNVARIDLQGSLSEVTERSQRYQASLLKFVIEHYRILRYVKVGALFQFMFADCWPSISWSVMDVNRVPKKGFYALQQAYQPILPVALLNRKRWMPGRVLEFAIKVINDTHEFLVQAAVTVRLEGKTISWQYTGMVDVPADGISPAVAVHYDIGEAVPEQTVTIDISVDCHGRRLASNQYEVEFSAPPPMGATGPKAALNG